MFSRSDKQLKQENLINLCKSHILQTTGSSPSFWLVHWFNLHNFQYTDFNIVISLLLQTTKWCLELEWPKEVICLLKMGPSKPNSHYHMDKIFYACDATVAKSLFNDWIVSQSSSLRVFDRTVPLFKTIYWSISFFEKMTDLNRKKKSRMWIMVFH